MISFDNPIGRIVEPYFASLGREVRTTSGTFQASWVRLALGNGPVERTFAISLGYTIVALGLAIYMNILTAGTMKHAGKAVRTAIRQQLLVVKVCSLIFVACARILTVFRSLLSSSSN
jgi:E3 ubiquitin-protein ligase MARCH6